MTYTQTQLIANTREVMDATSSSRWTDAFITTALGLVSWREWGGILKANPMYRFASRSVTAASDGTVAFTALDSGSADSKQNTYKILSVTDGMRLFRQSDFAADPLATTDSSASRGLSDPQWYEAGSNVQIIPAAGTALTIAVNWRPPRVDQLAGGASVVDFPDGRETILWLEAGAYLLSKGGVETSGAQTLRAMADQERTDMYSDLARRSTRPLSLGFSDSASAWAG